MTASLSSPGRLIRWRYLWFVGAALAVLGAAIAIGNLWLLNWVHVMSGVLWTGIDLFMGFVIGPILRQVDVPVRKAILTRLPWPQLGWIVAALVLVTLMTIQGLGYLLPTSVRICLELQKAEPDGAKIGRVMSRFYDVVASQGVMQVAIIVVMARLATGV